MPSLFDAVGYVRIVGDGDPILTPHELKIEVYTTDGTWVPLRGVCSLVMHINPQDIVRATMEIEINTLDLTGVEPNPLWVQHPPRSRWRRILSWVRGT